MGMPLHLAFNLVHHELLTGSGRRWGEIIVPEDPFQLEMTLATGEAMRGAPDDLYLTVHAMLGARYRRRQQVEIAVGLVGGAWKAWPLPARAAAGRFAIRSRARASCGEIRWTEDRARVEVLDREGNLRLLLSPDELPAGAGERARLVLHSQDRREPMLYVAILDGDLPRGRSWVTTPPASPQMDFPRMTRHELLASSGRAFAHATVPDLGNGCHIALFASAGEPAHPIGHLAVGFAVDGRAWLSIDRGTGAAPETWSLPSPGTAGALAIGASGATLEWSEDRARVSLLDAGGAVRVVLSAAEEPARPGERCRRLLRPHGADDPRLHLLLLDGDRPVGPTSEFMTP